MPDDDDRNIRDADRIWRIEQRQKDLIERLNGFDKALAEARGRADQAYNSSEILRDRIDRIGAGRNSNGGQKSIFQDTAFVRNIIVVLITGMIFFATGKFFNIGG